MAQYIDKAALVAEIERRIQEIEIAEKSSSDVQSSLLFNAKILALHGILSFIDTLEVKEVDKQKERMSECPYRQVKCTMYEDKILECNGACSWVVDYPKLKKLKALKGEKV